MKSLFMVNEYNPENFSNFQFQLSELFNYNFTRNRCAYYVVCRHEGGKKSSFLLNVSVLSVLIEFINNNKTTKKLNFRTSSNN